MMFIGTLRKKINSLFLGIRKFGVSLGLFLAVALAGGSVAASFFVPTKALGVFLSAVGCFAAGWVFAVFLSRSIQLGASERETNESLLAQLTDKTEANARLENEIAGLRSENRRLERQRIDINAVRPVLKLGLMEAEMSIKDVKIAWMNDFDEGGLFSSATRSQYVGVLQRSFKATYGVDLSKLRVREDGDCLRVAGISAESLGFKDDETEWLVRQAQKYTLKETSETAGGPMPVPNPATGFKSGDKYYEIDKQSSFEGSIDLNATAEASGRQERELRTRLNKGIGEEFRNVNGYIREMAEGFIGVLLSPVKKPVVFVETPLAEIERDPKWLALEDYAKEYNRKLDSGPAIAGELE